MNRTRTRLLLILHLHLSGLDPAQQEVELLLRLLGSIRSSSLLVLRAPIKRAAAQSNDADRHLNPALEVILIPLADDLPNVSGRMSGNRRDGASRGSVCCRLTPTAAEETQNTSNERGRRADRGGTEEEEEDGVSRGFHVLPALLPLGLLRESCRLRSFTPLRFGLAGGIGSHKRETQLSAAGTPESRLSLPEMILSAKVLQLRAERQRRGPTGELRQVLRGFG